MPSSHRIIIQSNLVIIAHVGHVTIDECFSAFEDYLIDPERRSGQNHVVDMSQVIDFEMDYPRIIGLQARVAGIIDQLGDDILLVLVAPTAISRKMASLIAKSWDHSGTVKPRIVDNMQEASTILGHSSSILVQS